MRCLDHGPLGHAAERRPRQNEIDALAAIFTLLSPDAVEADDKRQVSGRAIMGAGGAISGDMTERRRGDIDENFAVTNYGLGEIGINRRSARNRHDGGFHRAVSMLRRSRRQAWRRDRRKLRSTGAGRSWDRSRSVHCRDTSSEDAPAYRRQPPPYRAPSRDACAHDEARRRRRNAKASPRRAR